MSWKKCLEKYQDNYFYYSDTKECIENVTIINHGLILKLKLLYVLGHLKLILIVLKIFLINIKPHV